MKSSVTTNVVGQYHCIGCGMCVALCPQSALAIRWNHHGEYGLVEVAPCATGCGLCLKICPFSRGVDNEDKIGNTLYGSIPDIQHRPDVGYFLASYVGYAEKHRPSSASGGLATWLLEELLIKGVVDHVICVAPTRDSERLFTFKVFNSPEDVRNGAGSAYYPVEMSAVIKQILEVPGRYAITGLPCFLKGVRLAQQRNVKLRDRVVITVGLVCGQLKSRHFTDYIAALAGVQGNLTCVSYRSKSQEQPASNLHYTFTAEDGRKYGLFWRDGISEAWRNRWFTPEACNYCDDIFAECADITCMDAWLPEYSENHQGTSIILVRSPLVRKVIEQGQGIFLNPIPIERVVQSQSGVIEVKRRHLTYRLHFDKKRGRTAPIKRVSPTRLKNPFLWQEIVLKERMRVASRDIWSNGMHDSKRLQREMQHTLKRMAIANRLQRVISLPAGAIRIIKRRRAFKP